MTSTIVRVHTFTTKPSEFQREALRKALKTQFKRFTVGTEGVYVTIERDERIDCIIAKAVIQTVFSIFPS